MNNPHPFKRLLGYALGDRKLLRQTLLLLIIATAADIAGPLLIKVFIDDHVVPGQWQMESIALLGVAYVFSMLLAAWINYLQAVRLNLIAQNAVLNLRQEVFAKILIMPLNFFDRTPAGNLISRVTNDTESIKDLYVSVIGVVVQNSIRIIGILIAMAVLDWHLMIICLLFVPIAGLLMYLYQRLSTPLFHHARALLGDINARLHESFQGMRVMQLLGQEPRFRRDFSTLAQQHYQARLRNVKLDSYLLRPAVDLIQMFVLIGLLFTFGYQSLDSTLEIGVIYAFVAYLGRFAEPLIEITQRLNLYQQAIVASERVFTLLDDTGTSTPERLTTARIETGKIKFANVHFSYDGQREVIKDVSFTVAPGHFYAIVGHTGSGKSTLTQLLLRFYAPQHGEIQLDDQPLEQIDEPELRLRVGIVQQDPFIFNSSVRANITMGQYFSDEAIQHAAELAGLHTHVQRLAQGYNTVLEERGANLSTGQRQLLALARALVHQPKILILDEATANIDSHTEAQIQQALLQLRGQVTLVVIAHRLSTIEKADEILVMHQGEIAQRGSHRKLLQSDGIYKRLYEMQSLEVEEDGGLLAR